MRASDALVPFGFTALESEVYAFLAKEHPATGYRIARAIGKPAANTYKAIQSLERKGAITVDEGANRSCTPVPPERLLERLNRRFESDRRGALEALRKVATAFPPGRPVPIGSTAAALGAARAALGAAKEHVLVHAHASLLHELAGDLEAAAGVADVYVLGRESEALAGVEWLAPRQEPGYVLELAADGASAVLAAGEEGGELSGLSASDHPFGAQAHRLLASQMAIAEVARGLAEDVSKKQLARILESVV